MNWLKIILYTLTYVILIYTSKDLFINSYISIHNLFGHIRTSNELNVITSVIVEILTLTLVIISFFIPVGKKEENKSININYYIDTAYNAILHLLEVKSSSNKLLKRQMLLSLLYTTIIFFIIIIAYILLITKLSLLDNGLKTLYFLFFTYIVIQITEFLTSIVIKIDKQEKDLNNSDFIYKKNTITWSIIVILFLFLYLGIPLVDLIYNQTHEIIGFSLFDYNRIGITK